jgi:solute carrier family 25 protein 16
MVPTLVGMVPYAGVSFAVHHAITDTFRNHVPSAVLHMPHKGRKRKLRVWAELVSGGVSGALAQTSSYPLEIIRRRLQVADMNPTHSQHSTNMVHVARDIWRSKGTRGFFVGLSIGYIKVVPLVGISFAVYEQMKYTLHID